MWDTWVRSLCQEDPLEEGTATHSSILPGKSHEHRNLVGTLATCLEIFLLSISLILSESENTLCGFNSLNILRSVQWLRVWSNVHRYFMDILKECVFLSYGVGCDPDQYLLCSNPNSYFMASQTEVLGNVGKKSSYNTISDLDVSRL